MKKEENAKEADDELQVLGRILQDENAAVIKEGREKKKRCKYHTVTATVTIVPLII